MFTLNATKYHLTELTMFSYLQESATLVQSNLSTSIKNKHVIKGISSFI